MDKNKRRERRKKITVNNGKGPDGFSIRKGLDAVAQKARSLSALFLPKVEPWVAPTYSYGAFEGTHICPIRQARKRKLAFFNESQAKPITMKKFRKLENKLNRKRRAEAAA